MSSEVEAPSLMTPSNTMDSARVRRAMLRGIAIGLALGALTGVVSLLLRHSRPAPPLPSLGAAPAFQLTDQAGQPFSSQKLEGHPWIIGFVFTGCTDSCPLITARMAALQGSLKELPVQLVTLTVDPLHDTPEKLLDYGRRAGADFSRWSFLTGPVDAIRTLVVHGFKLTLLPGDPKVGEPAIVHDDHLALVDGRGQIRGYYDGEAPSMKRLEADARQLAKESQMTAILPYLGGINACFNALSATFLLVGFFAIRSGRRDLHRLCMLSAITASALFLAGYLTRAAMHGTRSFGGTGVWRTIYFAILLPHMTLAIAVVPLVGFSLYYALSGRFDAHRRIVRWTFPIWMYVSVTGVIVYGMLYHWPAA